jgi:hypothetical protein
MCSAPSGELRFLRLVGSNWWNDFLHGAGKSYSRFLFWAVFILVVSFVAHLGFSLWQDGPNFEPTILLKAVELKAVTK